jgi:hypothetical protein
MEKVEGSRPLGRLGRRSQYNIKIDLLELAGWTNGRRFLMR